MIIHTSENAISRLPYVQLDSSFPFRDIAHMVLAGGPSQTLYNLKTGMHERSLDFLCRGGEAIVEDQNGFPHFERDGSQRLNETLGMFAVAGVRFDRTPIRTSSGNEGVLEDLAEAAMKCFSDDSQEKSWSLMLFSIHPGVQSEWSNDKGELHSAERILKSLISKPYGYGSCFGTHVLEGISFAIKRFCLEQDVEPSQLQGVWYQAYEYLTGAMRLIKKNQREDGSLKRSWFRKKSFPSFPLEWREVFKDVTSFRQRDATVVYATGHCLDAICSVAEFLPAEYDWIQPASYILAQTIETHWTSIGRNVGPLTHAIHALKSLDV